MKLLLLTHRIPFPPNKGDKIRSFHLLEHLSRRHEIHLASLIDDEADLAHVAQVSSLVHAFAYELIGGTTRKALALRGLIRGLPATVTYFYTAALQRRIDEWIDDVEFDCCFCYSSPMAEYLFRSRHARGRVARALRIMDLIDVDSYKWQQYAQQTAFWKAWVFGWEARNLSAYERHIARSFDRLYVVSDQERQHFPTDTGEAPVQALGNGVDLKFFSPSHVSASPIQGTPLVFTGVMDYWPNIEGITWFVDCVLPRIQASVPDAWLYVVGSKPTAQVRRLAHRRGVTVTGFVEDVRDYLASARVCVVPLRIARGIQNKILEAMAMGRPVVTTAEAFEGVRAQAGEEIAVADDEEDFVRATVCLLRDTARADRMGSRARTCMEQHYGWDVNLRRLAEVGL